MVKMIECESRMRQRMRQKAGSRLEKLCYNFINDISTFYLNLHSKCILTKFKDLFRLTKKNQLNSTEYGVVKLY